MKYLLFHNIIDGEDDTITLTTSSNGIPVLRIEGGLTNGDFAPSNIVHYFERDSQNFTMTAADMVHCWAAHIERTEEELKAADSFLRQWPEGPQVGKDAAPLKGHPIGPEAVLLPWKPTEENQ